jgi:hypothetical protein
VPEEGQGPAVVKGLVRSLTAAQVVVEERAGGGGSRLWTVRASIDPSEPLPDEAGEVGEVRPERAPAAATLVQLAVVRNLSCSESRRPALGSRNQTFRTRWNCLVRTLPAIPAACTEGQPPFGQL